MKIGFTSMNTRFTARRDETTAHQMTKPVLERKPVLTLLMRLLRAAMPVLALFAGSIGALAQGTAFTYQGQLNNNGNPVNGSYDLSFSLYNVSSGGSAFAGPVTNLAGVTNGLFTVTLDFGASVFTGTTCWLDISVRTNGGGPYNELSPRQQITPAPYAVFSESSGLAASVTPNGVSAPQLNTAGAPVSGEVLAFNGTGLVWTNPPAGAGGWALTGNAGTIPGTDFLGTSDSEPFELWVNGSRALRLEPGSFGPNVIGGANNNSVAPGNMASTIGGGVNNNITGANNNSSTISGGSGNTVASGASGGSGTVGGGFQNTVSNLYPTISGGEYNSATANGAVVGGGYNNVASGKEATISGGAQNIASGPGAFVGGGGYDGTTTSGNSAVSPAATVGGGLQNTAGASYATVGGGSLNTANGLNAVVPGGYFNTALGSYSLAAGYGAEAMNSGAFVWADNSGGFFSSTANNQFSVRANGGVRFVTGGAGVTIDGVPVGSGGGGGTSGWGLTGNAGTDPNVNFLGTTDGAGLEFHVNSARGLRLDFAGRSLNPGNFYSSINVDGGFGKNTIAFPNPSFGSVLGGTIAGGGYAQVVNLNETDFPNTVNNDFGTVGGGYGNTAGLHATVPGGYNNSATGDGSFAAGRNAQTTYAGNFVWSDGTQTFSGSGANYFDVLASGGVNFNAGNNDFSVVGEFMSIRGLGNEEAYIGGDGSGNDVQIGSLRSGITAVACYNTADSAYMHLYVSSITIEGGADLAEPFQISSADKKIPQGAVVVIDEDNPGQLKISDQPYDSRVAGVVSGANGIHPGIQMQQQGLLEGGKNVALTGRVYVQADVSNGPIKPGDLLTTSTVPGRAMRVSDQARAQGAILGKAMTGLKDGTGMVLVLVSLQ